MPFSFPKRLFFHNLSATYSFGRRIKGRAADFISATRPFLYKQEEQRQASREFFTAQRSSAAERQGRRKIAAPPESPHSSRTDCRWHSPADRSRGRHRAWHHTRHPACVRAPANGRDSGARSPHNPFRRAPPTGSGGKSGLGSAAWRYASVMAATLQAGRVSCTPPSLRV